MNGFQGIDARAERRDDQHQIAQQPHSPWLNTADLAAYLRYTGKTPLRSVYRFLARHGIVTRQDGHRLLVARVDVDRVLSNLVRAHSRQLRAIPPSSVSPKSGQGVRS